MSQTPLPSSEVNQKQRPVVFLDFDDTVCLNTKYGGYDTVSRRPPHDIWDLLFHRPAVEVLRTVNEEFHPRFVITSSWLQFLHPDGLLQILRRCDMAFVANNLHAVPEAPMTRGRTRADAIAAWLQTHHAGEPYVVLDDKLSGTGLTIRPWSSEGRVILCEVGVGLLESHLPAIRRALAKPAPRRHLAGRSHSPNNEGSSL